MNIKDHIQAKVKCIRNALKLQQTETIMQSHNEDTDVNHGSPKSSLKLKGFIKAIIGCRYTAQSRVNTFNYRQHEKEPAE